VLFPVGIRADETAAEDNRGRNHRRRQQMTATLPDDVRHLSWAVEQLGIGISTCYRLAKSGHLPGAFQIGSQWRISVPAFEAQLREMATPRRGGGGGGAESA
jgi:excisionase family DNA binding protein